MRKKEHLKSAMGLRPQPAHHTYLERGAGLITCPFYPATAEIRNLEPCLLSHHFQENFAIRKRRPMPHIADDSLIRIKTFLHLNVHLWAGERPRSRFSCPAKFSCRYESERLLRPMIWAPHPVLDQQRHPLYSSARFPYTIAALRPLSSRLPPYWLFAAFLPPIWSHSTISIPFTQTKPRDDD